MFTLNLLCLVLCIYMGLTKRTFSLQGIAPFSLLLFLLPTKRLENTQQHANKKKLHQWRAVAKNWTKTLKWKSLLCPYLCSGCGVVSSLVYTNSPFVLSCGRLFLFRPKNKHKRTSRRKIKPSISVEAFIVYFLQWVTINYVRWPHTQLHKNIQ